MKRKVCACVCVVQFILALPGMARPGHILTTMQVKEEKMSKRKFHAFNMETNILTMSQLDINVFSLTYQTYEFQTQKMNT